jgi:hypothetical protein
MAAAKKPGKAARIQARLFDDVTRFISAGGKFSPLPWCLRRVQWMFPPRTWQVYTYLVMRSGQEGVTWHTDRQIAVDIDVTHRKVAPHLKELAALGFIALREHDGERFCCILDPFTALNALVKAGKIQGERLERLNEDLDTMGLPTLPWTGTAKEAAAADGGAQQPAA